MRRQGVLASAVLLLLAGSVTADAKMYMPEGRAPEEGWPVLVYLQGYGVTKEAFDGLVGIANANGMAVLKANLPNVKPRRNPQWDEIIDYANASLQAILSSYDSDSRINTGEVHLAGFGQGAIHAVLAVMTYPDLYSGVFAVSPAVAQSLPESWEGRARRHPLFLMTSRAEAQNPNETLVWIRDQWSNGGGTLREETHTGDRTDFKLMGTAAQTGLSWIASTSRRNNLSKVSLGLKP